jgi:tetratricopeptide (TPR) repeat protein
MVCLVLIAGCQAFPVRAQAPDPNLPPGLEAREVQPIVDGKNDKATQSLDDVLKQLKRPDFLPDDPAALQKQLDEKAEDEPPIVAMLYYVQARMAWEENRMFEARQHLERALRLAPNNKHLLEMLAQLWASSRNLTRSVTYLQQMLKVDPLNMELVIELGAFSLELDRYEEAASIFHYVQEHAAEAPDADPALLPLVDYYIAVALERAGYALASIESNKRFISADIQALPRDQRQARRMELLLQQKGALWRQVGDAYCQLKRYDDALQAYRTAVLVGGNSKIDIMRRLVYVCLQLDKPDMAAASVLEMIGGGQLDENVVELILFMVNHVPDRADWIAKVQNQLKENKVDPQTIMKLADLFDPKAAQQMVRDQLKQDPADLQAIKWMLDHQDPNATKEDLKQAVEMVVKAMVKSPLQADLFSVMLVAKVKDQKQLVAQIQALPDQPETKALRLYLLAQAYSREGEIAKTRELLEQAIALEDQLLVARLRLAVLHMSQKELVKADDVLKSIKDQTDPRVVSIRVKLLTQANRLDEVLLVIDRALEMRQGDVELLLQKAQVQIRLNKSDLAERTLLDGLNMNPLAEPLYEALFEMYEQGVVPDAMEQYKRLMMRVLKTIPQSRVARLHFADHLSASGETNRAENIFKELLKENPKDYRAITELLELYRQSQKLDKADALLLEQMQNSPDDRLLMLVAQTHYQETRQKDKWFELTEKIIRQFDDEPMRTLRLGSLYLEYDRQKQGIAMLEELWQKPDLDDKTGLTVVSLLSRGYARDKLAGKIDKLFDKALKRYPKQDADLLYTWAQTLDRINRHDRSEQIMEKLLKAHPDHGPANNGLGYTWANQGKNLDRALAMIQKAVETDPGNAAYLDSLGWVFYKLGKFEDAVTKLKAAKDATGGDYPVILDHLGDAQYRNGDVAEAIRSWQRAQHQMSQPDVDAADDPELKGLAEKLKAKITASSNEKEPPVADVKLPE